MKLELEVYRYGKLVFGRVLRQDESLRRGREFPVTIAVIPDFSICSCQGPELGTDVLYVRGSNRAKDNFEFSQRFDTETKATNVCAHIKKCLAKVNDLAAESTEIIKVV